MDGLWKWCDFGAVTDVAGVDQKATKDIGTEGYQAPEAKEGEYSTATDITVLAVFCMNWLLESSPAGGGIGSSPRRPHSKL